MHKSRKRYAQLSRLCSSEADPLTTAAVAPQFLLQLATTVNSVPLPPVPEVYGIRLPPPAQRLTAPNYTLVPRSGAPPPPPGGSEEAPLGATNDLADLGGAIFGGGGGVGAGSSGFSASAGASGPGTGVQTAEGSEAGGSGGGLFGDDDDDEDEDDDDEEMEDVTNGLPSGEGGSGGANGAGGVKRKAEEDEEYD